MIKLVIIAGASRGIGKSFLDRYKANKSVKTIGINRTGSAGLKLDLEDKESIISFIESLDFENIEEVVYIHSIGIDKFEPGGIPEIDEDKDGIDDEVRKSNLVTFFNFVEHLIFKVKKINVPLTICNIGSISDIFNVPYWQSFSKTKNEIRRFCKSVSQENVKSIFLNVGSTLDDENQTYGRKDIDITYWQTSKELVEKSFEIVNNFQKINTNYAEFDFFKPNPNFTKDYFTNLSKLYKIWQKDLGYEGKEIPLGIRI